MHADILHTLVLLAVFVGFVSCASQSCVQVWCPSVDADALTTWSSRSFADVPSDRHTSLLDELRQLKRCRKKSQLFGWESRCLKRRLNKLRKGLNKRNYQTNQWTGRRRGKQPIEQSARRGRGRQHRARKQTKRRIEVRGDNEREQRGRQHRARKQKKRRNEVRRDNEGKLRGRQHRARAQTKRRNEVRRESEGKVRGRSGRWGDSSRIHDDEDQAAGSDWGRPPTPNGTPDNRYDDHTRNSSSPSQSAGVSSSVLPGTDMFSHLWNWMQPNSTGGPSGLLREAAVDATPPPLQRSGWSLPALQPGKRPNIILMIADDLDVELGSLEHMPLLRRYLQDEGVTFDHSYVTTPLCCPSRSSFLTGMLIHNHGVFTNRDNCSGPVWAETHEQRTYATYLQQAGYRTGYFGKYMNRYDGKRVPPGWHHWQGLVHNSRYYNYSINVDGRIRHHGARYPQDYLPELITRESLSFLSRTRSQHPDQPALLVLSYPTPHGPEDAAPQHTAMFLNTTDHHTPSYNFAPNADKQWFLRYLDRMEPVEMAFTDILMTKRLQTLQSLDSAIEQVYHGLAALQELNNTYIMLTSDHGYHLGQFGMAKGKSTPFEFDIRVPLIVRGPGIQAGSRVSQVVLNVDVAPTLLGLAGVAQPPQMDGRSLMQLLSASDDVKRQLTSWPGSFLVEAAGKRQHRRRRVRVGAVRPDDEQGVLYVSALQRLQHVCPLPEYSLPCQLSQKWACHHDGDRWRVEKCRRRSQRVCLCDGEGPDRQSSRAGRQQADLRRHRNTTAGSDAPPPSPTPRPDIGVAITSSGNVSRDWLVSEFVLDEDAGHVDVSIRQIGRQLHGLQAHAVSMARCASAGGGPACPVTDRRTQRRLVRSQIYRLKKLLIQLKVIRRHLSGRRAGRVTSSGGRQQRRRGGGGRGFNVDDFEDYADEEQEYTELVDGYSVMANATGNLCPCGNVTNRAERQWVREYNKHKRREQRIKRRKNSRQQKRRRHRKKARLASSNCDYKGLNCFVHDDSHWQTRPLWTHGSVCICVGAANDTYDCVRTVNATDNWLYCRFATGFLAFYNMTIDPYQLHNLAPALSVARIQQLDGQLAQLLACAGPDQCRQLSVVATAAADIDGTTGRTVIGDTTAIAGIDGATIIADTSGATARADIDGARGRTDTSGATVTVDVDGATGRPDIGGATATVDVDGAVGITGVGGATGTADVDDATSAVVIDGFAGTIDLDDTTGTADSFDRDDNAKIVGTNDTVDTMVRGGAVGTDDAVHTMARDDVVGTDEAVDTMASGDAVSTYDAIHTMGRDDVVGTDDAIDTMASGDAVSTHDAVHTMGRDDVVGTDDAIDTMTSGDAVGTDDFMGK